MRGAVALLVGLGAVAVACGGAGASGPTATLGIVDPAADVRTGEATDFVTGTDGEALGVGDDVRTDRAGFAEITYADGSLTRLDRASEFRVVALSEEAARADTEVDLQVGRAWNRVSELGPEGRFEVGTSVATASVRGTAFDVDCAFGCLFRVFEGSVEVTTDDGESVTLAAGEAVVVAADGTLGPLLALAGIDEDPWPTRNLALDGDAGFPAVAVPPGPDPAAAGIGGTWDVRFTATDASTDPESPPGSVSDVSFTIAPSCAAGPCDSTIDAGVAGTFDVRFVDGQHLVDDTEQTTTVECQPQPVFDRRVTGQIAVTAVRAESEQQAAVFVGTIREEFTPLPDAVAAGCAEDGVRVRDSVVRGVLAD